MFFKKKKNPKSAPQVIEILGKVEVQPPKVKTSEEVAYAAKVAYVEKYFSRNRIESSRKGIFVSRELVNRLADYVHIIGQGEASIGAYVEEIILDHLNHNKDTLDALFLINPPRSR